MEPSGFPVRARFWAASGLLLALYVVSAKLGLTLAFVNASATAVWPPTGIAMAGLLLLGYRVWPVIFIGAFFVNLTTAGTVLTSLGIATGNCLEGLAGAYLVSRFAKGPEVFDRAPDILKFAVLGGALGTLVSPTLGVASLCWGGLADWASYGKIWGTWWLGDMAGAIIVTPFVLLWVRNPKIEWRRVPEVLLSLGVILLLGQAVFGGWFVAGGRHFPLAFLGGPLLLWTAYRYGPRETALGVILLTGTALKNTLAHLGPFGGLAPDAALLVLQSFAAVTSISSLALAAAVSERNLAENNLQKARRAERALAHSEKYFRSLIENALDVVTILDAQGTVLYESPSVLPVLGYGPEELNGSNVFQLIHEEDLPRVREKFEALRADPGRTQSVRFRCRHKDGSWRDLESIGRNALGEAAGGIIVNSRDITERQIDKLSLRESEERFRQLSEATREGIVITREGVIQTANRAFARMFGYAPAEMTGMMVGDLVEPGSRPQVLQNIAAGVEEAYEFTGRRKDGSLFPGEVMGKPVTFEGREARVASVRDLTFQKKAEESLREQAGLMKSIVDNMGEGLLVCDGKGKTLFVNPAALEILGGQVGDPLPQKGGPKNLVRRGEEGEALSPEEFPITKALRGEPSDGVELFIQNPGKPKGVHVVTTSRPLRDGKGGIKGGVSVFRDITDQKRAFQSLKDSEERFRLLVNFVKDYAIFLLDPEGKVMTWNDGAKRLKGYSGEEIIGRHFSCFYTPEDLARRHPEEMLRAAEAEGRAEEEGWRVRKDGSRFWAESVLTALRDEGGTLKGFAKITRDISEKKKLDELARSNKELEQFAYVASHDLQEPLRMVASFVQLLAMEYKGKLDETADQYIQEAVGGVKRMQALILDLLAYSRLDSGGRPGGRVDCAEALGQALSNLEMSLSESGAKVSRGALPVIRGDFQQITQLFQNLIANAVKFKSAAPPEIRVEAVKKEGEWLFSVRDNGIGLEARYAEQIFEIFKRLHTRHEYPGTGIGLAICKKVVTRHGGRIWVESELGKGATFYWTLPLAGERETVPVNAPGS
ncbi:MAG TPA: PAS domain S-box protein [bacterium]|nr:PAS domain S-box protein [bacterium]